MAPSVRPWNEPSKPMMSIRSGWPLAQWYFRAVLMATSIALRTRELVKNTTSAKVTSVSALARRACSPGS